MKKLPEKFANIFDILIVVRFPVELPIPPPVGTPTTAATAAAIIPTPEPALEEPSAADDEI
jgi:hypothetical protein